MKRRKELKKKERMYNIILFNKIEKTTTKN